MCQSYSKSKCSTLSRQLVKICRRFGERGSRVYTSNARTFWQQRTLRGLCQLSEKALQYIRQSKWVSFWATVCKTVRPMLSDRCLSVCDVGVAKRLDGSRWNFAWRSASAKLLHGDPTTPPKKRTQQPPIFCPCLLWPNGWMDQNAAW